PSSGLVVVQVHELASLCQGAPRVVLLPLANVHEALGEAVAVRHVVAAASPDPVPAQVVRPKLARAAAAAQLTVPARAGHRVHHAGGGHGRRPWSRTSPIPLTYVEHGPEHGVVGHGGAVPAAMPELVLALADAQAGPPAHVRHVVLVQVAQLGLAPGQAQLEVAAEQLRAQHVHLRVLEHVHALQAHVAAVNSFYSHPGSQGERRGRRAVHAQHQQRQHRAERRRGTRGERHADRLTPDSITTSGAQRARLTGGNHAGSFTTLLRCTPRRRHGAVTPAFDAGRTIRGQEALIIPHERLRLTRT
ncbi:unnamed protein product, partial [Ixodes hexagonus]